MSECLGFALTRRGGPRRSGARAVVVLRPRALAAAALVATLGCGGTSSADAPAQGSGAVGASGSERSQDAQRSVVTIKGFEFLTPRPLHPGRRSPSGTTTP